jgi:hypothetical protein
VYTLEPVVANIQNANTVEINTYLVQDGYPTMNTKHMLGPWDRERWKNFISEEKATNGGHATIGIPGRIDLRILKGKLALTMDESEASMVKYEKRMMELPGRGMDCRQYMADRASRPT